jgi:uncharacterized protein YndB with AHSA1/START domain
MAGEKEAGLITRVHELYIRSTPEQIWEAITSPEWTAKYGYRTKAEFDLRPDGKHRHLSTPQMLAMGLPETCIDGKVIDAVPPRKLVHSWRFLFAPEDRAEGFTRVTWEIEPTGAGFCRLTVTHEQQGPRMAASTASKFDGRGWRWLGLDFERS